MDATHGLVTGFDGHETFPRLFYWLRSSRIIFIEKTTVQRLTNCIDVSLHSTPCTLDKVHWVFVVSRALFEPLPPKNNGCLDKTFATKQIDGEYERNRLRQASSSLTLLPCDLFYDRAQSISTICFQNILTDMKIILPYYIWLSSYLNQFHELERSLQLITEISCTYTEYQKYEQFFFSRSEARIANFPNDIDRTADNISPCNLLFHFNSMLNIEHKS